MMVRPEPLCDSLCQITSHQKEGDFKIFTSQQRKNKITLSFTFSLVLLCTLSHKYATSQEELLRQHPGVEARDALVSQGTVFVTNGWQFTVACRTK